MAHRSAASPVTLSPVPVAAYLRMSTDKQQYSIAHQDDAIRAYAAEHQMVLVRSYRDEGRSGLTSEQRPGLQALLQDIASGHPGFEGVLVLDVSRWGRFQNIDEAAYYEFLCWKGGVRVSYVNERFVGESTPFAVIFKGLKRVMAAEYSRELSAKVSAGHRRWAHRGFRQGAVAGYGLRRLLVDSEGMPRQVLREGQRKYLATDRVILVPGPPEEVRTVRWIFHQYLAGQSCSAIARLLNQQGLRTHCGTSWSFSTVRNVLRAEKYAGVTVYGRSSKKLAARSTPRPKSTWVRNAHAHEAVVSPELFAAVQARRQQLRVRLSDAELVGRVRSVLAREGRLSKMVLDAAPELPSSHLLARRFGTLTALYRTVGFTPTHNSRWRQVRQFVVRWRATLTRFTQELLVKQGSAVKREGWCLRVDDSWSLSFMVLHGTSPGAKRQVWFNHRPSEATDIVVFARMVLGEPVPRDYFVLPKGLFSSWPKQFYERNTPTVDSCRYPSLAILCDLALLSRRPSPCPG